MSHPHTSQADRDALDDLGLVAGADRTEDLRPSTKNALGRCWSTAEGLSNNPLKQEQEF